MKQFLRCYGLLLSLCLSTAWLIVGTLCWWHEVPFWGIALLQTALWSVSMLVVAFIWVRLDPERQLRDIHTQRKNL